jgi:hypothetical protein
VEVLAAHKNEKSWREPIVRDTLLSADYSDGVRHETARQFQPDNRSGGSCRAGSAVHHRRQEPFVAQQGFLVQVPYRNVYQLESVGAHLRYSSK